MSLMGTLAKVAVGVMVAKGVGKMVGQGRAGEGKRQLPTNSGTGGLFDQKPTTRRSTTPPPRGGAGGLEDLLGGLLGGGGAGGALGGILGGAASGGAGGGLGGLLEQLGGAKRPLPGGPAKKDDSFGDLLNSSFDKFGEPETPPTPQQDEIAGLLLRAMIQAAKADGKIDAAEKAKLLENLGEIDPTEMAFVNEQLEAPVDTAALARDVPNGMEAQVYMMSVMAIDLDQREEAQYLHKLAQALNISQAQSNQIHEQLGVPTIYN